MKQKLWCWRNLNKYCSTVCVMLRYAMPILYVLVGDGDTRTCYSVIMTKKWRGRVFCGLTSWHISQNSQSLKLDIVLLHSIPHDLLGIAVQLLFLLWLGIAVLCVFICFGPFGIALWWGTLPFLVIWWQIDRSKFAFGLLLCHCKVAFISHSWHSCGFYMILLCDTSLRALRWWSLTLSCLLAVHTALLGIAVHVLLTKWLGIALLCSLYWFVPIWHSLMTELPSLSCPWMTYWKVPFESPCQIE